MKIFLVSLLFIATGAVSADADEIILGRSVFGQGGNSVRCGPYMLNYSVGQSITGSAVNGQYQWSAGYWGFIDAVTSAPDHEPLAPVRLYQNYPNPFNPATIISYSIGQEGRLLLQIFDVRGGLVRTLVNENQKPGRYNAVWDGCNDTGRNVSSGIYFCRISTGSVVQTKKLVLMR